MDIEREAKRNRVDKELKIAKKIVDRKTKQNRKWKKNFDEWTEREKLWKWTFDKKYKSILPVKQSKKKRHSGMNSLDGTE